MNQIYRNLFGVMIWFFLFLGLGCRSHNHLCLDLRSKIEDDKNIPIGQLIIDRIKNKEPLWAGMKANLILKETDHNFHTDSDKFSLRYDKYDLNLDKENLLNIFIDPNTNVLDEILFSIQSNRFHVYISNKGKGYNLNYIFYTEYDNYPFDEVGVMNTSDDPDGWNELYDIVVQTICAKFPSVDYCDIDDELNTILEELSLFSQHELYLMCLQSTVSSMNDSETIHEALKCFILLYTKGGLFNPIIEQYVDEPDSNTMNNEWINVIKRVDIGDRIVYVYLQLLREHWKGRGATKWWQFDEFDQQGNLVGTGNIEFHLKADETASDPVAILFNLFKK